MELKFYSNAATSTLLRNLKLNLPLYLKPDVPWAPKFLAEDAMVSPVHNPLKRITTDADFSFVYNTKGKDQSVCDAENAIMVHKVLRSLNRKDASDPNFWVCLCHENPACYEYTYKRWLKGESIEEKQISTIEKHFFVGKKTDSSSLDTPLRQRNALSRLFWSAALTYNEKFSNDVIKEVLINIRDFLSINQDEQSWFNNMKEIGEKLGFAPNGKTYKQNPDQYKGMVGDIAEMIRITLTTRKNSPNLYYVMQILKKDECDRRFNSVISKL